MDLKEKKVEKIISELKPLRKQEVVSLLPVKYIESEYKKNNNIPSVDENWSTYDKNQRLGGYDKHYWIHTEFVSPECDEKHELRFSLSTSYELNFNSSRNPQCILYVNGEIVAGLDLNHIDYVIEPNKEYVIDVYLYTGLFDAYYDLNLGIVLLDKATDSFFYDLSVPFEACCLFDEKSFEHIETVKQLNIAANYLDLTVPFSDLYYDGIKKAADYLEKNYYGKYPNHIATVDCIGHTHIDVAWLWTYAQTREKVQRSFSTVVSLMKRYPEYKFMISQPQLLEYLKEEAPAVFEEIKALVSEGRIEVEGAMWVESDCNLPSGESLVRQIVFGKRYFKEEFGVDSKILWLPDVFGYCASIPQILKKTGVDKFVTSKLGWNEYNKIPCDLFKWSGIDGSEVFAHFMTGQDYTWTNKRITSYANKINPSYVLGTWDRQQQKEYTDEVFMTYGYGDGGGGPTEEMLEEEKRISRGVLGIPRTKLTTTSESLNSIENKFMENAELINKIPKWSGELYLEFHRGTYTSVGKVKRYNRKGEYRCQNAEKLSVLAMLNVGASYDKPALDKAWKILLLNQFHDVIPGSSIKEVYDDVFNLYDGMFCDLESVTDKTIQSISEKVAGENKLLVFNPNGFEITDVVKCGDGFITAYNIPAMGWKVVENKTEECEVKVFDNVIENKFYKVVFDENFDIVSLYDKLADREVIREGGKANQLIMYQDLPYSYDAWELSEYHRDKKFLVDEVVSVEPISEGARAGYKVVKRFRTSTIIQKIYLYNELDRIDFDTKIDWNLTHIIAKAAFSVDVNTNKATYEIQFGNIERNHTENTSWDKARFETCAHKWVDIADNGYGMALMNDCKYGYSVVDDSTIQLSLLRSGDSSTDTPNVNDQGEHIMSYSIVPHKGNYIAGDIARKASAFNNPLIVREINNKLGSLPAEYSFISVDKDNVIIDTVKRAENSENIVIRLYESQNISGKVNILLDKRVKKAYICDMLENKEEELEISNNKICRKISNFEIVTLMLEIV